MQVREYFDIHMCCENRIKYAMVDFGGISSAAEHQGVKRDIPSEE
jgi:hypothetical protein